MIIRQLALRHGRRAIAQHFRRSLKRFLATEVDSIEASLENSLKETHAIESQINSILPRPVPTTNPETHATSPSSAFSDTIAERWQIHNAQQALIGNLGADKVPGYQPHTLLTNPPSPADVTLELLLASEAHQGHATSLWNPANARYIHGIRQGIHIISLDVTAAHLRRAAKVVTEVSRRGGLILFVGTREGQDRCVTRAAELAKGCHLFERWIPGSITNGQQILGRCRTKVVDENDQDVAGFEDQLYDRAVLRPDLVVCMNPLENYVLLHECALNNIPTIGVIDTDADPTWVTYPIPANDDSLRCIQVIAGVLGRAGQQGQKARLAAAKQGVVTFDPSRDLRLPDQPEDKAAVPRQGLAEILGDDAESFEEASELQDKMEEAKDGEISAATARGIKKVA